MIHTWIERGMTPGGGTRRSRSVAGDVRVVFDEGGGGTGIYRPSGRATNGSVFLPMAR